MSDRLHTFNDDVMASKAVVEAGFIQQGPNIYYSGQFTRDNNIKSGSVPIGYMLKGGGVRIPSNLGTEIDIQREILDKRLREYQRTHNVKNKLYGSFVAYGVSSIEPDKQKPKGLMKKLFGRK